MPMLSIKYEFPPRPLFFLINVTHSILFLFFEGKKYQLEQRESNERTTEETLHF